MMGKKGSEFWAADTMVFYILFGIGVGLAAVVFLVIVSGIGDEQAIIYGNVEQYQLTDRISRCFSAENTNTIDYKKFTEENLIDCYRPARKNFAFRLALTAISNPIKTPNWDDNAPSEKLPPRYVVILKDNKKIQGELIIEVQQ